MTQYALNFEPVQHAPKITPRPYQVEARQAVEDAWGRGVKRPLVQLATGLGKTVLFNDIAKDHYPVLMIAHREELLAQAADKLRQVDPHVQVGYVMAGRNQMHAEFVVASIQTLAREKRLHQMPRDYYRLIVVDEAHHAVAESYRRAMAYFDGTPMLGVTATPERGNGGGLEGVWDELVYQRDMLWGIANGYLSDIRGIQVRIKNLELGRVKVTRFGDFQENQAGTMMSDAGAPEYAVRAWQEHAADRKGIIFTPNVALADEMRDAFLKAGVRAASINGETSPDDRRRLIHQLRAGEVQVVANCAVWTEGFDEPSVDCIIVARPTLSRVLYVQMIGRGTRLAPGKSDCLVIDMVGATERLNLITVPNLFGVSDEMVREEGLLNAKKKAERDEEDRLEGLDIESVAVDLFTQRKFNWIRVMSQGAEQFVLNTGTGFVYVTSHADDPNLFDVRHVPRQGEGETIAAGLEIGYATGAAEDYVRRLDTEILAARDAGWRSGLASDKQISALQKWGVKLTVDDYGRAFAPDASQPLTKGQASDLLTQTIAKRKRR